MLDIRSFRILSLAMFRYIVPTSSRQHQSWAFIELLLYVLGEREFVQYPIYTMNSIGAGNNLYRKKGFHYLSQLYITDKVPENDVS